MVFLRINKRLSDNAVVNMEAILALEDGRVFRGESFGASGERCGEVVFNTSMTGYQEILTDPSYKGQIVVMTYPLIGNYGINKEDMESQKPFLEGFVVKECSKISSNWRSEKSLADYLKENNLVGIEGIDTRELTLHIRQSGAMKAVLSTEDLEEKSLIDKARKSQGLVGRDLVKEVTSRKKYTLSRIKTKKYKVVVLDCGVKYNILRELSNKACQVTVLPAWTTAKEILSLKPDGVLLSNGPGDPSGVKYVIETTKNLIGKVPLFGICLGHQILGLALGGVTYKLKFGHHGANHPVKDLRTGKVYITAQNHGFCLDIREKPVSSNQKPEDKYYMVGNNDVEITYINLNDGTCEGMRHRRLPVFSVQFHPEASAGPHDAKYLFKEFIEMMRKKPETGKIIIPVPDNGYPVSLEQSEGRCPNALI